MSWQDLGGIGEFVSAIAVVFSLVYVAHQIRQNTRQIDQNREAVRAAAIESSISQAITVRQDIIKSEDVARIFHAGSADPKALTDQELDRYRLLMTNILWAIWNIFSQSRFADLSSETWDAQIPLIERLLSSEGGRWFWANYSHEFVVSFKKEIDRILGVLDDQEASR